MSWHQEIQNTSDEINKLHRNIGETYRSRSKSDKHKKAWQNACTRFHNYTSSVTEITDRCYEDSVADDRSLKEFALDFLETDPVYFRSGYFKEHLLTQLKRASLSTTEKKRLQKILLKAVVRCARREFKRYGRLANLVADDQFIDDLKELRNHDSRSISSRAKLMLKQMEIEYDA